MIPEFTERGLLPPGIHSATWSDFSERFIVFRQTDQRIRVGRQLQALYDEVRRSGIVRRLLITGSLVTDKDAPNDFDCLLVLDPTIVGRQLPPFQYNLVSRRMARKMFKADVVPVLDESAALAEYLEFFQTTRDGDQMGIVEVQL